ncbi:MAG: DUF1566 domain-containing protein [Algicola sp.]|nr:DUF1566 domain-containing protein [Algicola sp.]
MIKKIKTINVLVLAILLTTFSCSKDDDQPANAVLEGLVVSIDENPTNGQVIGTVQTNEGAATNFSISSQTPSGALSINSSSGEVTVADASLFDFESNSTITATITAENAEDSVTVTVNLDNVFEITIQDFTETIDENPTDGQVIGALQTSGGTAANFSITSQTPVGAMNIDANTGELTVVDPNLFDFETNPIITATVTVDDAENPATVTVNLNDVDEITVQEANFTLDENPANGDVIGTLQASAGSALTYTITFQNPAGAFNIDQNTGELSVADETLFDYETNSNMLATISVDNGTYSVSANAFVALNDLNEVGEFKYGGVIFWVDPADNGYGLVSAITDQSTGATWGCQGTLISGTSTSFASGETNTAAIIAGCATPGIAADIAVNTTTEGYSDWFLPSWNQLNAMYANKAIIDATATANGGTAFPASMFYWSSSESNSDTAWAVYFDTGSGGGYNKGASANFRVRVVREFDVAN